MRYKVKTKDCRLYVRAKTSFGESIDEKALDAFARTYIRGFLKAKLIKKNTVEYAGPVGISLYERLKKPISKRDFLLIMEQLVLAVQKVEGNRLQLNNVVFDLKNVFINDVTKEVQFLYLPMTKENTWATIMEFVESVVYSVIPADEKDSEYISRFILLVKAQEQFIPEMVEKYIAKEDRSVVNTIKKQNAGQSGFMTSKQMHYYDHYDQKDDEDESAKSGTQTNAATLGKITQKPNVKETNPIKQKIAVKSVEKAPDAADEEATGLLEEEATGLLEEEATGLLEEEATGLLEEEATGLLEEEATGLLEEEATGLLEEEATGLLDEEATGLLDEEATGLLDEEATGLLAHEETVPCVEKKTKNYPTLLRVLTKETISVNKPVFRLGKERSYVDYFVSNNNAVSRSHADIITRGSRYFVLDLNSKNHTYINEQMIPVQCETELRDGDTLKLGNEEFVFRTTQVVNNDMFCHHCGKKVEHTGKFCVYCGSRLVT